MKTIMLLALALLLMAGCASTAHMSADGLTLTTRTFPGQRVDARFPGGASISSGFWEGPKQVGVSLTEGAAYGFSLNDVKGALR